MDKNKTIAVHTKRPVLRHKMYKSKKQWVVAGVVGAAAMTLSMTAHADVAHNNAPTTSSTTGTQNVATGGNAVTATSNGSNTTTTFNPQTSSNAGTNNIAALSESKASDQGGTITTPVHTDHSQLDQAVQNAKNAGVQVHQDPTTSQTVDQSQVDNAKQQVQNDYNNQIANLHRQTVLAQHDKDNYNNNNGSMGDHSALDQAVQQAQNVPGLTVVKDNNQAQGPVDASDDNAINQAKSNIQSDYAGQISNINNAIATQKRNNQDNQTANAEYQQKLKEYQDAVNKANAADATYQSKLKEYQAKLSKFNQDWQAYKNKNNLASNSNVISSGMVDQGLKLGKESSAKVTFSNTVGTNTATGWNLGDNNTGGKAGYTYTLGQGSPYLSWGKYPWTLTRRNSYGEGSTQYAFLANKINEPNISVTATYTNLHNSSYTDNNGTNHHISKIIATYKTSGNSTDWPILYINTDPSEGFWYMGVNPVSVTYQCFDENGNLIRFNNNAWITVSSLNAGPSAQNGRHEYAQGTGNITFHQLAGSSITNMGNGKMGSVFVNDHIRLKFNSDGSVNYGIVDNTAHGGRALYEAIGQPGGNFSKGKLIDNNYYDGKDGYSAWDNANGQGQYYGATVGQINNGATSYTISYSSDAYGTGMGNNVKEATYGTTWAMPSTTIPETPFKEKKPTPPTPPEKTPLPDEPVAPTLKTTTVHYHYDVMNVTPNSTPRYANYHYNDLYTTETPTKHFVAGDQKVDGRTEINNDVVNARVDMQVPKNSDVEGGYSKLALADDYSKMASHVTYTGAQVLENDIDATQDYTITNRDNVVTATKNNPASTNGGTVSLVIDFKVNDDTPKGTQLVNSGEGTVNNSTVPTNTVQIVTYTQTPTKHWVEGSQVVDNKTYINDDVVTADVKMDLPEPSQLAQPLSNVTVTDDYSKFAGDVDLVGWRAVENGQDVTDQYKVVSNAGGVLSVARKDPAHTPAGNVDLITTFKIHGDVPNNTKLVNSGSGRINNHTVPTNNETIVTYTQNTSKHWVEGGQTVDDQTYIDGDQVHAQVVMSLPNHSDLAKPLSDVSLTDNYSKFANDVTYQGAQVFENNADVTDQYTIANANGQVVATRKDAAQAPSGEVRLLVNFVTNKDLPSGTQLVNSGSGRINNHTVNTNTAKIVTYLQNTDKHWVEGDQNVDGKTYVDGDQVHGHVTMTLPDPAKLAKKLSNVSITDNYTDFQDKVTYVGAHVYENGKDVTDQYTITNQGGQVTATRKNAQTTPGGQVALNVDWTINQGVPSGTKMVNGGSGTINNQTVTTPNRDIFTYSQPVEKHWVEGTQPVDGKTYIDDDLIHAQVTMGLPQPSSLAKKLTNVQLVDDYSNFANMVTLKSYTITEGGKDVTSLYNVTNANGHLTATRKDPSTTPGGNAQLNITWAINHNTQSGTRFHNNSWGIINNHSVNSNEADIVTYTQTDNKHWVEGSQVVDGKTYIDNDTATAQVTMSLPDPNTLAHKLTKVEVADNYSQMAKFAEYVAGSAKVFENGKDVTSDYNITTSGNQIVADRKDPGSAPAGNVVLKAQFHVFSTTPSGTVLSNSGWGTIDDDQVPTNTPSVVTYKQETDKHWTEGSQNVDGKVYMDADEVHTDVTMTLPDPAKLAKDLSKVIVTDNYTNFQDKVDYLGAQVFENGKDVTDLYTISNSNGYVTATRKDAATTPQGMVDLHINFQLHDDVPSNTILTNRGSGQINDEVVNTPDRTISTFKQDTTKAWQEGDQIVNGKLYIDNDEAHSQISTTLPDPAKLAKKLSSVVITDDYSNFSKYVDVNDVRIRENGTDATQNYNIAIDSQAGTITATRKDPASTPGGKATMYVTFHLHDDVPSNTQLVNKGNVKINNETVPTPNPSVSTYKPDTDKHWVEGSQTVDGKTYIDNDQVHGQVSMTLPEPSQLANKLTNVSVTDDYSKFASNVDYVSANVVENGKDVTNLYNITNSNGHVTATRKDASTAPGGNVELNVTWKIHSDVASGTQFVNSGSGTLDKETVPTPDRTIVTYKQNTDKHWVEGSQTVDGKTFIDGDDVTGQVTMSLPEPSTLAKKLSNVTITDDYSQFANDVDYKSAKVFENGTDVTSQYTISNENGKVVATRNDPTTAPNGQVMLQVTWNVHTDVPSNTQLVNGGSGTINSETVPTPNRTIVTYKQDTDKHWLNNEGQIVDGKVTINGDTVTARVNMTLPKRSEMGGKFTKIQLIDDFSKFADKVSIQDIHVYENGEDVTNQYNISVENNHVIATRKDPNGVNNNLNQASLATMAIQGKTAAVNPALFQSLAAVNVNGTTNSKSVANDSNFKNGVASNSNEQNQASNNGGQVSLVIHYQVNKDVPSGTKLTNYGSGTINDEVVPTNHPDIVTYTQEDNKHWVEGGQVVDGKVYVDGSSAHAQVTTTLPDPSTLSDKLTNFQIVDDYSKFATLVDVVKTQVLENGQDVTSLYNITNKDGLITATRKDASTTPGGNAQLNVDFKIHDDVKTDTDLVNAGSATINQNTVPTNTPKIVTYKPQGEKHWVLNNAQTDNKIYISGDQATAQISVNMPSNLAKPLSQFQITDNYSAFANDVKLVKASVLENGKDVTDEYNISNENGKVVATRKDASKVNGGTATFVTTFQINNDVQSGKVLQNSGQVTVDTSTTDVPPTKIVTWTPKATKDVEVGEVTGDTPASANGKLVADGQLLTYPLSTNSLPANRAEDITSHVIKDTLDDNVEYVGFKAFLADASGKLQDVTKDIQMTKNGKELTFTDGDTLLAMYNQTKDKLQSTPIIDLFVKAIGNNKSIKNQFTAYTNHNVTQSNEVTNTTPDVSKPVKKDLNDEGVNIDGKAVLPGSVNDYKMTWDLDQFKGIDASDDEINQGFYFVDDYPEDALDADPARFTLTKSDGQAVKGVSVKVYKNLSDAPATVQDLLKKDGITPKGAFIVWSADNPAQFFKDYVQTGESLTIKAPMTVKDAFEGNYSNEAYQMEFGHVAKTDIVSNNVQKINVHKDVVVSVDNQKSLDGSNISLNQTFDYKLTGGMLPQNLGTPLTQYGFKDDYDQVHDQYNGQYSVLLDTDVTLKDGTVLKKGTDVRKYTLQTIDTKNGSVDIEFDKSFLSQIDYSKGGFGASAYLNMKRIKAGDVYNKYTNTINGKDYISNTVKTHTDQPKETPKQTPKETPAKTPTPAETPKATPAPATPAQPVMAAATPQVATPQVATPEPVSEPQPKQQALPQTGNKDEDVAALLGLLALGVVGTASLPMRKKRYGEN